MLCLSDSSICHFACQRRSSICTRLLLCACHTIRMHHSAIVLYTEYCSAFCAMHWPHGLTAISFLMLQTRQNFFPNLTCLTNIVVSFCMVGMWAVGWLFWSQSMQCYRLPTKELEVRLCGHTESSSHRLGM